VFEAKLYNGPPGLKLPIPELDNEETSGVMSYKWRFAFTLLRIFDMFMLTMSMQFDVT